MFALSTLRMITRRYDVLEVDAIPFLQLFPTRLVAWLRRKPMVVTWHEYWGIAVLDGVPRAAGAHRRLRRAHGHPVARPDPRRVGRHGQRLRAVRHDDLDVHVVTPGIVAATLSRQRWTSRGRRRAARARVRRPAARPQARGRRDRRVGRLAERGIDARLTVIGAGPHAEQLRLVAARTGVADRIEFLDFLPEHADVLERMAAADLFLFPSVREGFGMVALEAMAMGTPVVTSDHADNFARHLVQSGVNGMVCAPDPDAFADAIEGRSTGSRELSAGAAEVAADFDWDRIADRAEAAYVRTVPECSTSFTLT